MTRDEYEAILEGLGEATDRHVEIPHQVEIRRETARALCVSVPNGVANEREVWLPKSQCRSVFRLQVGRSLAVSRSWLSRERLWWMTK